MKAFRLYRPCFTVLFALGTILAGNAAWESRARGAEAAATPILPTEAEVEALCAKVKPAFVFIAGGSGVVIQPDGLMLTNTHVIENGKQFDVRLGDGKHFKAKLLGRDVVGDLAVLQLEKKNDEPFAYLELGDSDALRIGEPAIAVGNPFGVGQIDQHPTYTIGIVSAVRQFQGRYTECIVTDAEVNPGNSGGPLVNMAGQVVGINGQISTRWGLRSNTGLGYAISAKQIHMWLPRLKAANGGDIQHGRPVGLDLQRVLPELPDSVVVRGVAKESAAEAAGFQANDRIVRWDGQPVPNAIRLLSMVGMYPEGHEVPVEVRRGDADVKLTIRLENPDRPKPAKPEKPAPPAPKPETKPAEKKDGVLKNELNKP
ncbi:MAG: trypsin-like peptidase domain-containing protein [Pirellulales bacterium]